MTDVACHFTPIVGWMASRDVYWGACPLGEGEATAHHALQIMASGEGPRPPESTDHFDDPIPEGLGCQKCGVPYEGPLDDDEANEVEGVATFTHAGARWRTPSGDAEPGSLYWRVHDDGPESCPMWDNCEGRHLIAVTPDGAHWDIDSRAGNCDRPDDRTHRCWVRDGNPEHEPPTVTAGKAGDTCGAGGGSIQTGEYHGFLRNGVFKPT